MPSCWVLIIKSCFSSLLASVKFGAFCGPLSIFGLWLKIIPGLQLLFYLPFSTNSPLIPSPPTSLLLSFLGRLPPPLLWSTELVDLLQIRCLSHGIFSITSFLSGFYHSSSTPPDKFHLERLYTI